MPKRRANPRSRLRHQILTICNRKCEVCGSTSPGEIHHIKPVRNGGKNKKENLIYLCRAHHNIADRITWNGFALFCIVDVPKTRENLIQFIRLIDASNTSKKGPPHSLQKRRKQTIQELFGSEIGNLHRTYYFPPPYNLFRFLKRSTSVSAG